MKKEFYFKSLYHFSNFCHKYMEISDSDLEALLFLVEKAIYEKDETSQYLINKFTACVRFQPNNYDEIMKIISIAREVCYGNHNIRQAMKIYGVGSEIHEEVKDFFKNKDYKPTKELIETLENLIYIHGLYFLYDENKELIYIGKSKNLGSRIFQSIKVRQGFYFKYKLPQTKSDTNILELYYISKYKPSLNSESNEDDNTTIDIDYNFKFESDFILIREEENNEQN